MEVNAFWLLAAFYGGLGFGIVLMALLSAAREREREDEERMDGRG